MMLVEAQNDLNKSKEMFESASKDVKEMQTKIKNAKNKLKKLES